MPSVLFVCSANRFRSPLAEAFFEQALAKEEKERKCLWSIGKAASWEVASAGLRAARLQPVLPDVLEAGRQLGIDLSGHQSQRVQDLELSDFDLILVMQEEQKQVLLADYPDLREHIYLLSQALENDTYDFPDTYGSPRGVRGVGDVLCELIQRYMCNICVLAIALHNQRNEALPDPAIDTDADPVPGPAG